MTQEEKQQLVKELAPVLTLPELARLCRMSPRKMSRCVNHTHKSFWDGRIIDDERPKKILRETVIAYLEFRVRSAALAAGKNH